MAGKRRILFIHHSTGANLLRQGNVRTQLREKAPNLELWDHSYNLYTIFPRYLAHITHHTGLTNGECKKLFTDYDIVLSNNSPKEYEEIFSRSRDDATLSKILSYDVVMIKNCYPTTKITSEHELNEKKELYAQIRDHMSKYKKYTFIIFTPPPLRRELTESSFAKRAQELARWMASSDFIQKTDNVFVFDFFDHLADREGFLKKEYCRLISLDSHPNRRANEVVSEKFVDFVIQHA